MLSKFASRARLLALPSVYLPTAFDSDRTVLDIKTPLWLLLAETAEPVKKAAEDAANGAARPSGFESMLPALAVIMVLFWFLILRPQKNKEKQFRSLVENLKETDRVVTIGGIHGVVTNVQRNVDGGIVTLRVDESTGAKIRVGANAIARVITEEDKTE